MAVYTVSVWVVVVYLGEHYVFDVIAGALYALVTYGQVIWLPELLARRRKGAQPAVS